MVNSLTGPVPGLGSSGAAAAQAYVQYRNANGGVCGRELVLRSADDGTDLARNRSIYQELDPQVLGFMGGIAGADDAGAEVVRARSIPVLGNSNSFVMAEAPTYFGIGPLHPDPDALTPKFRYLRENGAARAAVVYVSASGAKLEAQRQSRLMRAAGIEVVLDLALPLSTLSYASAARSVANSDADYLFFVHEAGGSASMARSLADIDYQLRFAEYIVAYGSNFIDLAGPASEGAVSWIPVLPSEDRGATPEHAAFLDWMERSAPGASADRFAITMWAALKVFIDTLEALAGPITREALLAQAAATGTYDAGGLIAPIDLGTKVGRGCEAAMIVRSGAWERLAPTSGFLC